MTSDEIQEQAQEKPNALKGYAEELKKQSFSSDAYTKAVVEVMVELIEKSNYGEKSAEVQMTVPVFPDTETYEGIIMFAALWELRDRLAFLGRVTAGPFSTSSELKPAKLKFEKDAPK